MRLYHCLCCRKVPARTPSPAWETRLDERRFLWTQCSEDRGFLQKKIKAGEVQFITEENTQCVLTALFFLRALFFLSYFVSLDLKWIIQSVSLVHVRLHQFDFVWCSEEGKKRWDVTCTLSWVLFVSTRVRWDETSERPGVKDSHYFVSAYANVLEDYTGEKAFQAPHIFSVWELS